ncbi:MAG: hypothetical protein MZV49_16695 [Rhodopseudomonas palustris]|nr:hypothetical protein [Rhodopseudomonas palustris]
MEELLPERFRQGLRRGWCRGRINWRCSTRPGGSAPRFDRPDRRRQVPGRVSPDPGGIVVAFIHPSPLAGAGRPALAQPASRVRGLMK